MDTLFKTYSTDLAAFLLLQEIELSHMARSPSKPDSVEIYFKDVKKNCRDLERVFLSSSEKKYRDILKYLVKQVHLTLKEPI